MKSIDGNGVSLGREEGEPLYSGNYLYWNPQFANIVREYLADFLPQADVSGEEGTSAFNEILFHKRVSGREVCAGSMSFLDPKAKVSPSDADALVAALDRMHAASETPSASPDAKLFIRGFALPDPAEMPEAWRIPAGGGKPLVLWGWKKHGSRNTTFLPLTPTSAKWPDAAERRDLKQLLQGNKRLGNSFLYSLPWRVFRTAAIVALIALAAFGLADCGGNTRRGGCAPVADPHPQTNIVAKCGIHKDAELDATGKCPVVCAICGAHLEKDDGRRCPNTCDIHPDTHKVEGDCPKCLNSPQPPPGDRCPCGKDDGDCRCGQGGDKGCGCDRDKTTTQVCGCGDGNSIGGCQCGGVHNGGKCAGGCTDQSPAEVEDPIPAPATTNWIEVTNCNYCVRLEIEEKSNDLFFTSYSITRPVNPDDGEGWDWPGSSEIAWSVDGKYAGVGFSAPIPRNGNITNYWQFTAPHGFRQGETHEIGAVLTKHVGTNWLHVSIAPYIWTKEGASPIEDIVSPTNTPPNTVITNNPPIPPPPPPPIDYCPIHPGTQLVDGVCRVRCPICAKHLSQDNGTRCPNTCDIHKDTHKDEKTGICPKCHTPMPIIKEWVHLCGEEERDGRFYPVFSVQTEITTKTEWEEWTLDGQYVGTARTNSANILVWSPPQGFAPDEEHVIGATSVKLLDDKLTRIPARPYTWTKKPPAPEAVERTLVGCGKRRDQTTGRDYFLVRLFSQPEDNRAKVERWVTDLDGQPIACEADPGISNAMRLYEQDIPRDGVLTVKASVLIAGSIRREMEASFLRKGNFITGNDIQDVERVDAVTTIYNLTWNSIFLCAAVNSETGVGASGTAFAVTERDLITNRHVVDEGRTKILLCKEDGETRIPARVVQVTDEKTDLAWLRVDEPILKPLAIDADGAVLQAIAKDVGERGMESSADVVALGYPYWAEFQDPSKDKVPTMARTIGKIKGATDADGKRRIIHTAQTTHGNSGGPLVAMNAVVIGVTDSSYVHVEHGSEVIYDSLNAIPALMIKEAFPQLFSGSAK